MAGHSHSSNVAVRKGSVDKKRGKLFSKLSTAIMSAVRQGGPDPDANLKLRYAIDKARAGNMPKDNIERVIKRADQDKSGDAFAEVLYEGYAPGGVALLVSCLTNNRHRTAPDIKHAFDKLGGNLGAPGSVAFLFAFKSILLAETAGRDENAWLELALDCGAEDVRVESELVTIVAAPTEFQSVKSAVEARGVKLVSAEIGYVPNTAVVVAERDDARRVLKLVAELEDNDDVQSVYTNYDIPAAWIEELGP